MLTTEPRGYQAQDAARIHVDDATYLAYEMGCGKSLVPIAYIAEHRPKMSLIICPKSVVRVWPLEFKKHLGKDSNILVVPLDYKPGKRSPMSGKEKLEYMRERYRDANKAGWPIVFVINYESARMEPLATAFTTVKTNWDLVVADEIHRCKSPSGKTGRFMGKLGKVANKRVGLSGTPMPHSPLDIWSQFRFLDKDIFGWSFTKFKARYAVLGGFKVRGRCVQVVDYKNMEELNGKFYSIASRVTKDEVLDLPDAVHVERYVELDSPARRAYDEMKNELITYVNNEECIALNAMVKVTRLQQITSGFAKTADGVEQELHDLKRKAILDVLEDIDPKEPVALFCKFKWDLAAVQSVAEELGRPFYGLWGGRDDVGGKWEPEAGGLLAVQVSAGSVGIDMTAARYAIYVSQTWNMGEYDQSLARTHRHGQDRSVTYVHLLVRDSIDEKIREALSQRAQLIEGALTQSKINDIILDTYRRAS
jgi:SNF2 family DNA or RNA helicase